MLSREIFWLCNQLVDQESTNLIVASYQRTVGPRPPGCSNTVVRAGQKADLGSGWHFVLITQTGLHGADLSVRSLLDTPWRSNTWNWVTSLWGSAKFLTCFFFFFASKPSGHLSNVYRAYGACVWNLFGITKGVFCIIPMISIWNKQYLFALVEYK